MTTASESKGPSAAALLRWIAVLPLVRPNLSASDRAVARAIAAIATVGAFHFVLAKVARAANVSKATARKSIRVLVGAGVLSCGNVEGGPASVIHVEEAGDADRVPAIAPKGAIDEFLGSLANMTDADRAELARLDARHDETSGSAPLQRDQVRFSDVK
jgi:hypothetical protein